LRLPVAALAAAGLSVSALTLAARAFHGPFHLGPIAVISPLNAQAVFGLCAVVVLLYRSRPARMDPPQPPWSLSLVLWALALAVMVFVCFRPLPAFHFLSDDYCLLRETERYVRDFPVQVDNIFFRPVGFLLVGLIYPWAGLDAYRWHLLGALVHAACSGLVFLLLSRVRFGLPAALAGAAIFGLHGSRPEAVVWLAGWFDMLATLFVLAGCLLVLEDLRSPRASPRLAALSCAAAAMLTKETGFVFPLLLPVLMYLEGRLSRRNLARAWPFFALAVVLFVYRWMRLGGPGGYPSSGEDALPVLGVTVLGIVKVLAWRLWAVLCFPLNWSVEPGALLRVGFPLGIAAAAAAVALARPDGRKIAAALAFVVVSALPAVQQLLIGPDMEKSRGLYLPSVGYALLIAAAFDGIRQRRYQAALAGAAVIFHCGVLRHNLDVWAEVYAAARPTCATVAAELRPGVRRLTVVGLPSSIHGVYCFRNCFQACVEASLGRGIEAVALTPAMPTEAPREDTLVVEWDTAAGRIRAVRP
jgi:hypothetical protein